MFSLLKKVNFQDLDLIDLEEFKYNGANITSFRLVNTNSSMVKDMMQNLDEQQGILGKPKDLSVSARNTYYAYSG